MKFYRIGIPTTGRFAVELLRIDHQQRPELQ
jgi:hypothetical protein